MNLLPTLALGRGAPTRRALLRALGVGAAAAPLVPVLDGWARAADGPRRRLLLICSPDGIIPERWWPTGSETNFSFAANSSLAPLEKHKSQLIVLRNLQRNARGGGGGHEKAIGCLWTGHSLIGTDGGGPSVDQIVVQHSPKGQTDFASLQFGGHCFYAGNKAYAKTGAADSYSIFSGPHGKMPAEVDPYKAFDTIFGGFTGGGGGPMIDVAKVRAERQSIIDFVKDDLAALTPKLGRDDRAKLDAHLEATRGIERRLADLGTTIAGCTKPSPGPKLDIDPGDNYPKLMDVMEKLVAASFACDRTRVASIQYSRSLSQTVHTWLNCKDNHHRLSHGMNNVDILTAINGWYMQRVAGLLDAFTAVTEQGQPMLDSMLVVYANMLHLGWTHDPSPTPCFFAGKAGGAIPRTGRLLDFNLQNDHNQMLVTVARAMGVDLDQVGDLGGSGPLPGVLG